MRITNRFNFTPKVLTKNNTSSLKSNPLKADTFSFCSKKQEDLSIYGADYSTLDLIDIPKTNTVFKLKQHILKGVNASESREALICSKVKSVLSDAKKFTAFHPQFNYDDVCQDLMLILMESVDKELGGEINYPSNNYYARKKDRYFEKLLKSEDITEPFTKREKAVLKAQEEDYYFDKLENEDLIRTLNKTLPTLSPKEEIVVRYFYGLGGKEPKSYSEIAEFFNISVQDVKNIMARAFRKLRKPTVQD